MENYSEKINDEERKIKNLKERKEENMRIVENRVHELQIEKQRRERNQLVR